MFSAFELFKIGIGPSSSHTVGPMKAAASFASSLRGSGFERVEVTLYGSLAWTGRGHATDKAVLLGLAGFLPATVDPDEAEAVLARVASECVLVIDGRASHFDPSADLIFDMVSEAPRHPNTLRFRAMGGDGQILAEQRWCSVGGGFVVPEADVGRAPASSVTLPYPFRDSATLLRACLAAGASIAEVQLANECAERPLAAVEAHLDAVVATMLTSIERGLHTRGVLPGGLGVKRRASALAEAVRAEGTRNVRHEHGILDRIGMYAIAVNEENAAGGRIVTAPTNGAAGVVPAVLRYARESVMEDPVAESRAFLLTATAVGALFKIGASISGAEVGCQGEVGVACSMAAAGLAAVLGGAPAQVENAAEIGMEHHLGMTCDPVGGLVQVPCIERNAFGAIKAVAAASLALRGDGSHVVSLDAVIRTMRETGADMLSKYKETSLGGLAVAFPEC